jgi:hypothetical protein
MRRRRRPTPRRPPAAVGASPPGGQPALGAGAGWWSQALEVSLLGVAIWTVRWAVLAVYLHAYGTRMPNGDVDEYRRYALNFWVVQPIFHRLPVEYPPLAILPFTLTILPNLPDVYAVFAWWMGAILVAGYLWLRRHSGRARALTYAAYLLLAGLATVVERYDLVPALTTLLTLWAVQRRRFGWAYIWLALGILLKLYPTFLVPLVAVEQWRVIRAGRLRRRLATERGAQPHALGRGGARARLAWLMSGLRQPEVVGVARGVAFCSAIVALGFGAAALVSPEGAVSGFTYASSRPLQIESTPASLLWLGTFLGFPARAVYTYQSLNYVGPLEVVIEPLALLALATGCLFVYWRLALGRLDVGRAFVACLCVVIVGNKIFSPQYLIWILPVVAFVEGLDAMWLVICLLTALIFPVLYFSYPHILLVPTDWRFLPAVALRNVLLLAVTARALRAAPRTASPASSQSRRFLHWLGTPGARRSAAAQRAPASIARP